MDNDDKDNMSALTTKTQDKLVALLAKASKQLSGHSVGSWVASSSDLPPGSGPAATRFQTNASGQESILANSAPSGTDGNDVGGNASSGPSGK